MTHTLHREGDRESLENDYVVLTMPAAGHNYENSGPAVRAFLDLAEQYGAVDVNVGTDTASVWQEDFEMLYDGIEDGDMGHAVFPNFDDLEDFLTDYAEMDMGLSTVVSGLFDKTQEVCENVSERVDDGAHPEPHTTRKWFGVYGNRDRLAEAPVREVSTMCGHAMVSFSLIREMRDAVAEGRLDSRTAAERLAEPCVCGVFNTDRAQTLLERMAEE
ncbi:MAG: hypothetical protein ACOCY7_03975 [Halodesulfurarchaeum sp.]